MTEAWNESFAERLDDEYAPEPNIPGPVLRKRPIPDQLDYFSTKLAGLLDGAKLERDALITIGAAVVNLGALAAQLRKREARRATAEGEHVSNERVEQLFSLANEIMRAPTRFEKSFVVNSLGQAVAELAGALDRARVRPPSSITDGITDAEAEASATLDLTIDEVRALHPDDAAIAEMRAWIPEGTPDHALIELEAHTLRGVLAALDGWRGNAFAVAAQRYAAERELAELRAQAREEWGEKYSGGGYLTRPDFAWMDERWPVEQWAWDHTRHGGVVGKRRIIVVEDWTEIHAKDLPKERPEADNG